MMPCDANFAVTGETSVTTYIKTWDCIDITWYIYAIKMIQYDKFNDIH